MKKRMPRHFQTGSSPGKSVERWFSSRAVRLKSAGIACILMDGDMADEGDSAVGASRTRLKEFVEQPGNRCHPGRKR